MKPNEFALKCDCGTHLGIVTAAEDEEDLGWLEFAIGYWSLSRMGWRERVRAAWRILKTGKGWEDDLLFDAAEARRLGEWLIERADIIDRLRKEGGKDQ